MLLLRELPSLPLADRKGVIEKLMHNPSPGIRERALRVGSAVLDEDVLVSYLRSDSDAVLRNAALEILKGKEGNSFRLATDLLRDGDSDVVLQAVGENDGKSTYQVRVNGKQVGKHTCPLAGSTVAPAARKLSIRLV